jgi:hypothetical protein
MGNGIICSLAITREIDESYDVVNVEYNIKKVIGMKDKEDQLELFS